MEPVQTTCNSRSTDLQEIPDVSVVPESPRVAKPPGHKYPSRERGSPLTGTVPVVIKRDY